MATIRRQMKNMVNNYSDAEVKVREATSNDPWGPSSTLMSEISDLTYNIVALGEVMRMIWKRLNDNGKNWRHVYKSLVLLDYLIKNGNEKVAQQCKEHIVAIQTLKDFQFIEEQKDQGLSVREKAKQLVSLLRDDERLKTERSKAFKVRERNAQNAMGISSDNKIIYGTSNPQTRPGNGTKNGASVSNLPANQTKNLTSEIEAVRPSDINEEDLQIKIALMLSKQDHEEEINRKRADEAKLQIALEESKFEGQPNKLLDLESTNEASNLTNNPVDPWASFPTTNDEKIAEVEKKDITSSLNDIDNDEFFTQLQNATKSSNKLPEENALFTSGTLKPPENKTLELANDPWSSLPPPLTASASNTNDLDSKINKTTNSLLDDLWLAPNKSTKSSTETNLNLNDPWSSFAPKEQPKVNPTLISIVNNNPWSDSNKTPLLENANKPALPLVSIDPWTSKSIPPNINDQSNNNMWSSFGTSNSSKQSSNTAAILTNAIINDLWSAKSSTTNTVSSSIIPSINQISNPVLNNPFLTNSVFPTTNINNNGTGVMPNYSALSNPWMMSSSITASSTLANSNITNNPFID